MLAFPIYSVRAEDMILGAGAPSTRYMGIGFAAAMQNGDMRKCWLHVLWDAAVGTRVFSLHVAWLHTVVSG